MAHEEDFHSEEPHSFRGLFRAILKTLINIHRDMITKTDLDAALAEHKQALADAVTRITNKIDSLIAANPDLTDELNEIKDETNTIKGLAPDVSAS